MWTPESRAEVWATFAHAVKQRRKEASIPAIFKHGRIENLSPRLPAGYLELGQLLLEMIDRPQALAIGGQRGTGKTAIAAAVANEFIDSGLQARYTTAREYFDGLTGRNWGEKEAYRKPFFEVDLLVLDEVQVRDDREWQDAELTTLIDVRHRSAKSTLLLSNLEPGALKANLGDSIWRRIIETGGQPIETDWPRLQEWMEKVKSTK